MLKKPLYTNDEVAVLLKVSKRHLQYLRDTQQISYVQNGKKIFYSSEDLENFTKNNTIKKK